jgi:hypothetical protein
LKMFYLIDDRTGCSRRVDSASGGSALTIVLGM